MSSRLRNLVVGAAGSLLALCALIIVTGQPAAPGRRSGLPSNPGGRDARAPAAGRLPIVFIENRGQVDDRVRFYSRGGRQTIWLTDEGVVFDLVRVRANPPATGDPNGLQAGEYDRLVFRQRLVGADATARAAARDPRPGVSSFLIGDDPAGWRTGVRSFGQVVYRDVYPGIDLRLYANGRALEQEFVVHPGADPGRIRVAYEGVSGVRAVDDGGLRIQTAFGEIAEGAPRVYQDVDGRRVPVPGRFHEVRDNSYRFEIGRYRPDAPLVIDPTLGFSTYLGGGGSDWANDVAVDAFGNAYVTGYTLSSGFPVVDPLQGTCVSCPSVLSDAYVTKVDASGDVVYSTFLGGGGADRGMGIAVDAACNVFVVGDRLGGRPDGVDRQRDWGRRCVGASAGSGRGGTDLPRRRATWPPA